MDEPGSEAPLARGLGHLRLAAFLVGVLTMVACASGGKLTWVELKPPGSGTGQALRITGTVHHVDVEGGVYVIRDAEGKSYQPTNLPAEYRVDGLAVEADARPREDMMSIGMVGAMVDLLRIRKAAGAGK